MRPDLLARVRAAVDPLDVDFDQSCVRVRKGGAGHVAVYAFREWEIVATASGRTSRELELAAAAVGREVDALRRAGISHGVPIPPGPPPCGHAVTIGRTPVPCELELGHEGDHAGSGVRWSP